MKTGIDYDQKPMLLYNLPELLAEPGRMVFLVEGEKDADRLVQAGFLATTNPGGTGKWREESSEILAGRQVVIVPGNDHPGRKHALEVARGLNTAGSKIRIVELPGGDVSNWLDEGHTADELRELTRKARVLDDIRLGKLESAWGLSEKAGLTLTSMEDLLAEPEEKVKWLVHDHLPTGGLSLMTAKPKVGKSTLTRCLALAVARGEHWLGSATSQGPVLYLALEEKRSEVRRHFRQMGATPADQVFIYTALAPQNGLELLRQEVAWKEPALVIIDPLFRFTRVRDSNDYAVVTAALEPLMDLARQSDAHVLVTHHSSKVNRSGGDEILGSTALFGSVDTVFSLRRTDRYRTMYSIQRYGQDMEETVITLDEATGWVIPQGSRKDADQDRVGDAIVDFLVTQAEPMREPEIHENVEGRKQTLIRALRRLVQEGEVNRQGTGKRGDAYLYSVSGLVVPIYSQEPENQKTKFGASDPYVKGNTGSRTTDDSRAGEELWKPDSLFDTRQIETRKTEAHGQDNER